MRIVLPFLFVLSLLISSNVFAQELKAYELSNRIILLKESDLESDWLKAQIKRLESVRSELNDRQVLVFILANGLVYDFEQNEIELDAKIIEEQYALSGFEGLMLLDKDGSIMLKKDFIVNPKSIFKLIDAMPKRRVELNGN